MKTKITLILLLICLVAKTQNSHNYIKKDYVLNGYDLVSYFNNQIMEGDKNKFTLKYQNQLYAFVSLENLKTFEHGPEKYIPQYGGHCSYAMATLGKKVSPNPEVFEIRDGKLYFFHRQKGKENWQNGDTKALKKQADMNWIHITKI